MDTIEQLKTYIHTAIQSGLSPEEITQQLRTTGWDEATITKAFAQARAEIQPAPSIAPAPGQPAATSAITADGKKRGTLKTSWLLFKQSLQVLKNNKGLIRYPVMSMLFTTILLTVVIAVFYAGRDVLLIVSTDLVGKTTTQLSAPGYAVSFVYYVISFFVIFLYSAGLTAHVLDIFRGQAKSYKDYMKIARSKATTILIYAIINTTVGMILRFIEQRSRLLGRIIGRVLGAVWALANLFTIPVIVESELSAPQAIKESSRLFLARWGENIAARLTFGGIATLFYICIFIPILIVLVFLVNPLGIFGIVLWFFLVIISFIVLAVVVTAASDILSVALYYYAKYQQIPAVYDPALLNAVFIPKKPKKK